MSNNKPLVYYLEFSFFRPNQLLEGGKKKHLPVTQQGTEINALSPGLLLVSLFHASGFGAASDSRHVCGYSPKPLHCLPSTPQSHHEKQG